MSRSYKKTPIVKDNSRGRKKDKRSANKKVRNRKHVANGKQYRKYFNTWDIYDYVSYCSLERFMEFKHLRRRYTTDEEMKQAWRRSFYLK